jgi:hypothetical protein
MELADWPGKHQQNLAGSGKTDVPVCMPVAGKVGKSRKNKARMGPHGNSLPGKQTNAWCHVLVRVK